MEKFTAINWRGTRETFNVAGTRVHTDGAVTLVRQGKLFAVVYGLQYKPHLDYADAAREYGQCVFHQLACENKIGG